MATLTLSLVQDRPIELEVPQGVAFVFGLEWLNPDETPFDNFEDYSFLAQIRTNTRENEGVLVHQFSLTPDDNQNKYVIDTDAASTDFHVSNELSALLLVNNNYYFEAKMLDASGNPVEKIVMTLKPVADFAH